MNAPTNSPAKYSGTSLPSMSPAIQNPTVTAGFRCAPLNWPTANAPVITAMPQPKVMTIQPLFCPFDRFSSTQATTPLPSRIRSAVPITSAPKMLKPSSSPRRTVRVPPRATLARRVRRCQTARIDIAERISDTFPRVAATIQSIERAAAILRLLSGRERRLGVAQIAGELELPKGTVHGILRTLAGVGFVEQDPDTGKYQLGAALLHMGSSYLDGNELRARALNWSDSLAARSGESVRIGTLHDTKVLVVHHVFRPDDSRQALEVGALLPVARDARWARCCWRRTATRPPSSPSAELAALHAGDDHRRGRAAPPRCRRCSSAAGPTDVEELVVGVVVDRRADPRPPRRRPSARSASPGPSSG